MPMKRNTSSSGAPKRSASRLDRMPAITRTAPRRMAMLTESREDIVLSFAAQILAIASLSLAHHEANRFLPSNSIPVILRSRALAWRPEGWPRAPCDHPSRLAATRRAPQDDGRTCCSDGAGAPVVRFWPHSNQRDPRGILSRRDFDHDRPRAARRIAAIRGALGRRRGHLALVLYAARPDAGRRRDRIRRRRRGARPCRYDFVGHGLAGAASAVLAGA